MKKIISFSLWGTHPYYCYGAIENVLLAQQIFPDWECYVYYNNIDKQTENTLYEQKNVKMIKMNEEDNLNNMYWRFIPAFENINNIVIVRDTDSRLSKRDRSTVDDWLDSKYDFHIIRDNRYHETRILGGMWGCRNSVLAPLKDRFTSYFQNKVDRYDHDQEFLRSVVYPYIKNNVYINDPQNFYQDEKEQNNKINNSDNTFIGAYSVSAPNLYKLWKKENEQVPITDKLKDLLKTNPELFYFYT